MRNHLTCLRIWLARWLVGDERFIRIVSMAVRMREKQLEERIKAIENRLNQ